MDKIKEFLKAVQTDPKMNELIKSLPAPTNDEEAIQGYTKIAKEAGFDLTVDELRTGIKTLIAEQKAKAEKAVAALDENDLEHVAGGMTEFGCVSTYQYGEWCWIADSCAHLIHSYDDYNSTPDFSVCISKENACQWTPLDEEPDDFNDSFPGERNSGSSYNFDDDDVSI